MTSGNTAEIAVNLKTIDGPALENAKIGQQMMQLHENKHSIFTFLKTALWTNSWYQILGL